MEIMRNKLIKYAIFCNRIVGEEEKALNLKDLIENRLSNRHKKYWSVIKFKDDENNTICIERRFIDEGMSFEEIIQDYKVWNSDLLQEEILTIKNT